MTTNLPESITWKLIVIHNFKYMLGELRLASLPVWSLGSEWLVWASRVSCGDLAILLHHVSWSRVPVGAGCQAQLACAIDIVLACYYILFAFPTFIQERLFIIYQVYIYGSRATDFFGHGIFPFFYHIQQVEAMYCLSVLTSFYLVFW